MIFKRISRVFLGGMMALGMASAVLAQLAPDDPDWKEELAPPPPAFNLDKLVEYEGQSGSTLVYAFDPATLTVGKEDGIVRSVIVATSPTGTRNIMYEAIRCTTGEAKTYARYNDGGWKIVEKPEWRELFSGLRYASRFARAGACDGGAPGGSPDQIVRLIKTQHSRIGR